MYCGFEGAITDEHVFPDGIFIDKTIDQMLTVSACDRCNQRKSLADKDLQHALMFDIFATQHPDTEALRERIREKLNIRTKLWIRRTLDTGRDRLMQTDTGVIVGHGFEIDFNYSRIVDAHRDVIRGLFYSETGEMLLPPIPVDAAQVPWNMAPGIVQTFQRTGTFRPTVKGNMTAWWQSFPLDGYSEPCRIWLICDFNGILLLGASGEAVSIVQYWRGLGENTERRSAFLKLVAPDAPQRPIIVPRDARGRPYIP